MSRTHAEIQRLADRIGTHVALARAAGAIQPDQVDDLLACRMGFSVASTKVVYESGRELRTGVS
jgi:hypothetical protein